MNARFSASSLNRYAIVACLLCAATTINAQQYSPNAVGYVEASFAAGSSLVANPLNAGNNAVSNVLRGLPNGSIFRRYDRAAGGYTAANIFSSATGWTDPGAVFAQPEGGFLELPSTATVTFVGDLFWPAAGTLGCYNVPAASVMSVIPSVCAFCGTFADCPATPPNGTQLWKWNRDWQDWEYYLYYEPLGGWVTAEFDEVTPELAAGEAAEVEAPQAFSARFRLGVGGSNAWSPTLQGPERGMTARSIGFRFPAPGITGYRLLGSTNPLSNSWSFYRDAIETPTNGFVRVSATNASAPAMFCKLQSVASPHVLINPSRTGTQFRFQFHGYSGTNYTVERGAMLGGTVPSSWVTVATISGQSGLITVTNNTTASSGCYRLRF